MNIFLKIVVKYLNKNSVTVQIHEQYLCYLDHTVTGPSDMGWTNRWNETPLIYRLQLNHRDNCTNIAFVTIFQIYIVFALSSKSWVKYRGRIHRINTKIPRSLHFYIENNIHVHVIYRKKFSWNLSLIS